MADPEPWAAEDAREFLYTLQRLLGSGGICARRLLPGRAGAVLEIVGVGGRVSTAPLILSPAAQEWRTA